MLVVSVDVGLVVFRGSRGVDATFHVFALCGVLCCMHRRIAVFVVPKQVSSLCDFHV